MGTVRGKRNLERTELPSDVHEHVSKTLPNRTEHKIIAFLHDMRYARTSDISQFLGLSLSRTRTYLNRLYKDYYLFRSFPKVDKGSGEGYYCLDKASIFYLAANVSMTVKEFGWDYRYNINDPTRMDHTIDITKIRVAFSNASNGTVQLDTFAGEKKVGLRRITDELALRPDGEFTMIVSKGSNKYLKRFFLEYDRGTEDLYKIKEKVSKYVEYFKSEECRSRYLHLPSLLIVCNGELSERRFRAALDQYSELLLLSTIFITQLDHVLADPLSDKYEEMSKNMFGKLTEIQD